MALPEYDGDRSELETHAAHKQSLIEEREQLLQQLQFLDIEIINAQRRYGLIYNKEAPISKLPDETLCAIFRLGQVDNPSKNLVVPVQLVEVIISHVCSRWRSLALSLSNLWSTFRHSSRPTLAMDPDHGAPLVRLAAYLERSKKKPLDLWFNFSQRGGRSPIVSKMLDLVAAHIHRVRRFSAVFDAQNQMAPLRSRNYRDAFAPMLEQFVVITSDIGMGPPPHPSLQPNIFLGGAPMLNYLRLDCGGFSSFLAPLDNIVHLRLEEGIRLSSLEVCIHWTAFLTILNLPLLETLSISGELVHDPHFFHPNATHEVIEMKRLRHLRIGNMDGDVLLTRFLPNLSAPLLESLTLREMPLDEGLDHSLPQNIFPSLRSLYFIHVDIVNEDGLFSHIAAMTQKVKNITILSSDRVFSLLQSSRLKTQRLWPQVETITLLPANPRLQCCRFAESWPTLTTFRVPSQFQRSWSGLLPEAVKLEAVGETLSGLSEPWPPAYEWPDCLPDPFYVDDIILF